MRTEEQQELILKILLLETQADYNTWHNKFIEILPIFEINNGLRICHFFVQILHESMDLAYLEESFNYSKDNLIKTFPHHFNKKNIDTFYRKKEKIANKIYSNRMGNGAEESNDGYKFRGRGIIQITGRENYSKLNDFLKENYKEFNTNLIENPDILCQDIKYCIISACFFWKTNNLNKEADDDNLIAIRKKINGGKIGLDDCIIRLQKYKIFL